jgi:hypothetical protein
MEAHCLKYPVRGYHVILQGRIRVGSALAHIGICSKVEEPVSPADGILPPAAQQVFFQETGFTGIDMPCDCIPAPGAEGVNDKYFIPLCNKGVHQMGADEAGPACHHIKHHYLYMSSIL